MFLVGKVVHAAIDMLSAHKQPHLKIFIVFVLLAYLLVTQNKQLNHKFLLFFYNKQQNYLPKINFKPTIIIKPPAIRSNIALKRK